MIKSIHFLLFITFFWNNLLSQTNAVNTNNDKGFIYLGALETAQTDSIKIVRVLFFKSGNEWHSLEKVIADSNLYPSLINWFIAFDGKEIGTFHSKIAPIKFKDALWTYPRDAYHSPVEKKLPTIGNPDSNFMSWSFEENYRPLVVVSKDNCNDPENWKPYLPNRTDISKIYPIYKEYILKRLNIDTLDILKLKYLKSYQSNTLNQLIQIGMITEINDAEYVQYPIWIYKSNAGEIRNLSKVIDYGFCQDEFEDDDLSSCTLVDAGDYDADGKTEVVFWSSRYNGDGYVLFYNDFNKMTDFVWSYH